MVLYLKIKMFFGTPYLTSFLNPEKLKITTLFSVNQLSGNVKHVVFLLASMEGELVRGKQIGDMVTHKLHY